MKMLILFYVASFLIGFVYWEKLSKKVSWLLLAASVSIAFIFYYSLRFW
jgi:hypothetical protein